jgi:hypothetical protein
MRIIKLLSITLALGVLGVSGTSAKNVNSNAGTSSFPFLKINIGARAVSMGSAFTGLADDESALYYNPAGLVHFEEKRFVAEYHNYFSDLTNGVVGVILPWKNRVIGIHIDYLGYGTFTQTDLSGNITGEFGGSDMLLAGSIAVPVGTEFSVGATTKVIYEKLAGYSATGAALDLGVKYTSDRGRYHAGAMVQNLGVQFSSLGTGKKAKLPLALRLGGAARPREIPALLSMDLVLPVDNDPVIALGTEVYQFKPLYLRLGWNSFGANYRAQGSNDNWAGFSIGAGFTYKKYQISYAFSPAADLGQSHRITFAGGF